MIGHEDKSVSFFRNTQAQSSTWVAVIYGLNIETSYLQPILFQGDEFKLARQVLELDREIGKTHLIAEDGLEFIRG